MGDQLDVERAGTEGELEYGDTPVEPLNPEDLWDSIDEAKDGVDCGPAIDKEPCKDSAPCAPFPAVPCIPVIPQVIVPQDGCCPTSLLEDEELIENLWASDGVPAWDPFANAEDD